MSSYEVRAIRFIHQVFDYINECKDVMDYYDAVCEFNRDHARKVKVANGMTRLALITSDYVIKIDYSPRNARRWGGCEHECKFYNMARSEGMGYLFAKIKPYYYRGQVFYIMPRVHGIGRKWADADTYLSWQESIWCDDHNLRDLHNENYGWEHGHVVIIDYAANEFSL